MSYVIVDSRGKWYAVFPDKDEAEAYLEQSIEYSNEGLDEEDYNWAGLEIVEIEEDVSEAYYM